jgi:hypothetical protein
MKAPGRHVPPPTFASSGGANVTPRTWLTTEVIRRREGVAVAELGTHGGFTATWPNR